MLNAPFNLVDIVTVLTNRKKPIISFVVVAVIAATITVFLLPKYYRSVAIVVAANPALADKARLFNPNIEGLYSNYGSSDDLDRLYGIANLDTVYKQLVDEFKLIDYYKLKGNDMALLRRKAVLELREDLTLQKTELYQIKVFVYSKDRYLSATMANRMVAIVQSMAQQVWLSGYKNTYAVLQQAISQFQKDYTAITDSVNMPATTAAQKSIFINRQNRLLQQLNEYEKAAEECTIAINNNPPALIVLEQAYPSAKADRPKKLVVIAWAFVLSIIFACMAALLYDRNRTA